MQFCLIDQPKVLREGHRAEKELVQLDEIAKQPDLDAEFEVVLMYAKIY